MRKNQFKVLNFTVFNSEHHFVIVPYYKTDPKNYITRLYSIAYKRCREYSYLFCKMITLDIANLSGLLKYKSKRTLFDPTSLGVKSQSDRFLTWPARRRWREVRSP